MRLAGQSKAGFYPTPFEVLEYLKQIIIPLKGSVVTAIDPCCGDGRTLRFFLENDIATHVYGIELDQARAIQSKNVIGDFGKILTGNIFDAVIRPTESFSILFLNPPYDTDKDNKRMEITFLKHAHKWLKPGGLLIYIIPEHIMLRSDLRTWMSLKYENISGFRFPEGELFEQFKQVIVFAIKKTEKNLKSSVVPNHFEFINKIQNFPPKYKLVSSLPPMVFELSTLREDEIENRFTDSIEEVKKIVGLDQKEVDVYYSPIFPLRKGHLLAYITSGALNYVLIGDKVVKSFTTREKIQIETDEELIERDVYKTVLRVIDLTERRWYDVFV